MEKEFVPYEQALELKELGFDEICLGYYFNGNTFSISMNNTMFTKNSIINNRPDNVITAPLWQQAFSWCLKKLEDYNITYWCDESGHITYSLTDDCEYAFNSKEECLNKLLKLIKK